MNDNFQSTYQHHNFNSTNIWLEFLISPFAVHSWEVHGMMFEGYKIKVITLQDVLRKFFFGLKIVYYFQIIM